MKKYCVILMMFFTSCLCSVASDVFENQITAQDAAAKVPAFSSVSCKFSQEKLMKVSQMSLVSSGNFEFIKDKGVIFETTHPIQTTSSYTSGQNKTVNAIIKSISNQNYSYLEKNFDIYYMASGQNWILGLKPKASGALKGEMESIIIYGSTQSNQGNIDKMIISTQSVKTTLKFTNCG